MSCGRTAINADSTTCEMTYFPPQQHPVCRQQLPRRIFLKRECGDSGFCNSPTRYLLGCNSGLTLLPMTVWGGVSLNVGRNWPFLFSRNSTTAPAHTSFYIYPLLLLLLPGSGRVLDSPPSPFIPSLPPSLGPQEVKIFALTWDGVLPLALLVITRLIKRRSFLRRYTPCILGIWILLSIDTCIWKRRNRTKRNIISPSQIVRFTSKRKHEKKNEKRNGLREDEEECNSVEPSCKKWCQIDDAVCII